MSRLLIKICGVTHEEHIAAASESGADLVGLVLWPGSARHVTIDRALALAAYARQRTLETVALVVDPDDALLAAAAAFDRVQFHGNESCERLSAVERPTIRGFAFSPDALARWDACPHADWLIVDGPQGGGGAAFDHAALAPLVSALRTPWLLAGGLTPATVARAIAIAKPTGVDVSSGVERVRGVKDPALIQAFCTAARSAGG